MLYKLGTNLNPSYFSNPIHTFSQQWSTLLCAPHVPVAMPSQHRPSSPLQLPPLKPLGFYRIVGCRKQTKEIAQELNQQSNSCEQEGVLGKPGYSQKAGGQMRCRMPESLLSAKHAEVGPCGPTVKYIHNTCQEQKPRGASQGAIKHQNNARMYLGTMVHKCHKLFNPIIYHFRFD